MSFFAPHPVECLFTMSPGGTISYSYRSYIKGGHGCFRKAISQREFHRVLEWSQRWGLHRGSPGSLRLAHLNPTPVTTSREANRYRLEKMGMTG